MFVKSPENYSMTCVLIKKMFIFIIKSHVDYIYCQKFLYEYNFYGDFQLTGHFS